MSIKSASNEKNWWRGRPEILKIGRLFLKNGRLFLKNGRLKLSILYVYLKK